MNCLKALAAMVLALALASTIVDTLEAGTAWYTEVVPQVTHDYDNPSLVYNSYNIPYIAYYDVNTNDLLLAVKQGGSWKIDTVDTQDGRRPSIAMASTDHPHIAYSMRPIRLKYAFYTGVNWVIETIVDGDVGDFLSLAMGPGDGPQVAYRDRPDNRIMLAKRGPGGWTSEKVDSSGAGYRQLSLAVDSNGDPHIAYVQNSPFRMKYATKSGGVWTYETIDSTGTPTVYSRSLVVDASDVPHIAYLEGGSGDLAYGNRIGGVWNTEIAEQGLTPSIVGHFATLALAADGTPHIAHEDINANSARYTTKAGTLWITVTIFQVGDAGEDAQIAIAPDGNLGTVWVDDPDSELYYSAALLTADTEYQSAPLARLQIHPNPTFSGSAILGFTLARPDHVRLAVYDAQGRIVRVLGDRAFPAGRAELRWDGSAADGQLVEAGVYFVRLDVAGELRGSSRIAVVR